MRFIQTAKLWFRFWGRGNITSLIDKKRRAVFNFAHSTSQKSNRIASNRIQHYNVAFDFMQMRNGEEPHLHIGKVESQNWLCNLVACARKGLEIGFRGPFLRMRLFTSGIRLFIFDPKKRWIWIAKLRYKSRTRPFRNVECDPKNSFTYHLHKVEFLLARCGTPPQPRVSHEFDVM